MKDNKGHCYRLAYEFMRNHGFPNQRLVHAVCINTGDDHKGQEMGHAWVEYDQVTEIPHFGEVTTRVAYDCVSEKSWPASVLRNAGRVSRRVCEYDWENAKALASRTGIYGPWDSVIAEALHSFDPDCYGGEN